jgi:hypothetical protein
MGLSRFSLTQLAARIAAPRLGSRVSPRQRLALERWRRDPTFETARRGGSHFSRRWPVPGYALARSFGDLRVAGLSRGSHGRRQRRGAARSRPPRGRAERELDDAHVADRTRLFEAARTAVAGEPFLAHPLVLDVEIGSPVEEAFLLALATSASTVLATALPQDRAARRVWAAAGAEIETRPVGTGPRGDQTHLFDDDVPPSARATTRSSSSRRPVKAVSAWRSPAGSCVRRAAASGSTRWRC